MKKAPMLLLTILLVIAIPAIIIFLNSEESTLPENDSQENWKTYSSARFGFDLKYPTYYILEEKEIGSGERYHYAIIIREDKEIPINGEGPVAITIDVYQNNLDNQTLLNWITSNNNSNYKLSNGTHEATIIGGKEALQYNWSGLYEADTIVTRTKNDIIAFTVTYIDPEEKMRKDFSSIIPTVSFKP